MTAVVKVKLKERSKLNKTYYRNGQAKIDFDNLDPVSKKEYTKKMSLKLNDPLSDPKTY